MVITISFFKVEKTKYKFGCFKLPGSTLRDFYMVRVGYGVERVGSDSTRASGSILFLEVRNTHLIVRKADIGICATPSPFFLNSQSKQRSHVINSAPTEANSSQNSSA